MRKALRHAVTEIIRAGLEIEQIDQGGRHTTICIRGGGTILVHRGNRATRVRALAAQPNPQVAEGVVDA